LNRSAYLFTDRDSVFLPNLPQAFEKFIVDSKCECPSLWCHKVNTM
jgi:hypothetical protein